MGYLAQMYGKRSDEFVRGVVAGLIMFAWWADGVQYVGTCGTTLEDAINEAIADLSEHPDKLPSAREITMNGYL